MATTRAKKTTKAKTATSPKTKTCSLKEFRAWLEGMEEMLGDEWVPSKDQWKRIRNKINTIAAVEASVEVPTTNNFFNGQPVAPTTGAGRVNQPVRQPVHVPDSNLKPAPVQQQNITGPRPMSTQDGGMITTPEIDTFHKPYKSAFE